MKYFILYFVVFIFIFYFVSSKSTLFDELKICTNLQQDEFLIITYQNPGTCVKCYLEPIEIMSFLEMNKGKHKLKYLALVRCDRAIELEAFKKEIGWKYYLFVDDGSARTKLKAESSDIISILNYKGENLLNLKSSYLKENIKKIKKFIDDL